MLKVWTLASLICLLYSGAVLSQSTDTAVVSTTSSQIGFANEDFGKSRLQFYVYWRTIPRFSNFASYWLTLASECQDTTCVSKVLSGPRKLKADDLEFQGVEDEKFRSSSLFVNSENVTIKNLASSITARKFSSLKEKVKALIGAEARVLRYPDENAFFPMHTTDQILSRPYGRVAIGDCKAFANVFVALARATGITARIVNGFLMSPYGLQGHVWAEIKTNHSDWIAIDPLNQSGEISPLYIPTGIQDENKSESANDDVIEVLKQD
jgi:hypothetical protein